MDAVPLEDCLVDSPPHREHLARCEAHVAAVEDSLRAVGKALQGAVDAEREAEARALVLADVLLELARVQRGRPQGQTEDGDDEVAVPVETAVAQLAAEVREGAARRRDLLHRLHYGLAATAWSEGGAEGALARTSYPAAVKEARRAWERAGAEYIAASQRALSGRGRWAANAATDASGPATPTTTPPSFLGSERLDSESSADASGGDGQPMSPTTASYHVTQIDALRREYRAAALEYAGQLNEAVAAEDQRVADAARAVFAAMQLGVERDGEGLRRVGRTLARWTRT